MLALEGRFEVFTIGRDTEWEKVKEIYKLGLKHGMKLAAISGVNGVYTDEDIARVVALAKEARKTWRGGSAAPVAKKATARKKTAAKKTAGKKAPARKTATKKKATARKPTAKKKPATRKKATE